MLVYLLILLLIVSILMLYYVSHILTYNIYTDKSLLSYYLKPRIIVTLTTSPNRIYNIKSTLDSIMLQTVQPDLIILNLPKVFKRDNSRFTRIPDFILNNERVILNFCEDIGPATKIVPTCTSTITNDTDIIFSIDDDVYYPENILELYLYYHSIYPNSVLTGTSLFTIDNSTLFYGMKECELLEGFSCVLYKKKFLKDIPLEMFDKSKVPIYQYLSDDLVLSNYILKNNIKIYTFTSLHPIIRLIKPLEYGFKNDALHKGAGGLAPTCKINEHCNFKNYIETIKYMKNNKDYYLKHFDDTTI